MNDDDEMIELRITLYRDGSSRTVAHTGPEINKVISRTLILGMLETSAEVYRRDIKVSSGDKP